MRERLKTPAAFGPSLRLARRESRTYRLHAWQGLARVAFVVALAAFVPSVIWSFGAWGAWLLERQDTVSAVGRVPLPIVESSAFAVLGWALIAVAALHAWTSAELAKLRR